MTLDNGADPIAHDANASTPAGIDEKENSAVPNIDGDDSATRVAPETETQPPAEPEKAREINSRAARVEEIADAARKRSHDELEASRAALSRPDPEPIVTQEPDETVTLKVRGENIGLTAKERDDLAAKSFDGDISDLTIEQRNRYARMELAQKRYEEQLETLREQVKEAARAVREPAQIVQPAQATQAAAPEPAQPTPAELRAKAAEIIQLGGDVSEAARLQEEADRLSVETLLSEREEHARTQRVEALVARDIERGKAEAEAQFGAIVKAPVIGDAIESLSGRMQAAVMAQYIANQPTEIQSEFHQNGITPAYLASLDPAGAKNLYREMFRAGHTQLPPPGDTYIAAAKVVSDRFGQPRPAEGQPPDPKAKQEPIVNVDRTARKDSLPPTERAALPRQVTQRAAPPKTEKERAAAGFEEIAASRRGIPVRR